MQTYWDLTEKQRSALTDDDLAQFETIELMEAGVLRVASLQLETEPAAPEPDQLVYAIKGGGYHDHLAFASHEEATRFLEFKPLPITTEYIGGRTYEAVARRELSIEQKKVFSPEWLLRCRSELDKASEIRTHNDAAKSEYEAALKKQSDALRNLREDHRACCRKDARMHELWQVYEQYTATAGGDRSIAMRFLRKPFSDQEILDAHEWHETSLPRGFVEHDGRIEELPPAPAEAIASL